MENDFAALYAEEEELLNSESNVEEAEETEEVETDVDDEPETDEPETDEPETEVENESEKDDDKSYSKFAEMRVSLKNAETEKENYKQVIERLNTISQRLGFKDGDELLNKTDETLIEKESHRTGKSIEDIKNEIVRDKKISELEQKIAEREQQDIINRYSAVVTDFVTINSLSNDEVKKIEEYLVEDGFDEELLLSMQPKPLKRLFESYLPKEKNQQKELEEKAKIKQEIPLEQNSGQADSVDDEVEKLYKELNGIN